MSHYHCYIKFKIAVVNRDTAAKEPLLPSVPLNMILLLVTSIPQPVGRVVPKHYCVYKIKATVVSVNTPRSIISSAAHTSM